MGTGTLTFTLGGKEVTAYVSNAQSKSHMETLAADLHAAGFTNAAIPRVTYCEASLVNLAETPYQANADVGLFANVLLRRTSDGKLFGILIHAPNMNMFELVEGHGYKVTSGDGIAIADAYTACAGEAFTFDDGWLQGSSLRGVLAT